ncbi:MAG: TlpA family protein disulfide reductase [Eudoraea sp.]|nr:TlpA family protein disulfide reductase [Eudoraea sp.]NNL03574.1 TlpA family protein disulfide reductase [Eudoraea sp.]
MKLKRTQLINIAIILLLALYFFTPIGFHAKVYLNRLISHNPVPVAERTQKVLEDYDFKLVDTKGNRVNLIDYKGQVVFINFWATWCPPCVAEMPDLQLLYNAYGEKVAFLFIARDKEERVSNFLVKKNYDLPVYFESGFTPKPLYSAALPTTFIIDKEGNIVVAETGSADWNAESVRNLLDGLLK